MGGDTDGVSPSGEGDFFSVLLQNHITGVSTPRSDRPARSRPAVQKPPPPSSCPLTAASLPASRVPSLPSASHFTAESGLRAARLVGSSFAASAERLQATNPLSLRVPRPASGSALAEWRLQYAPARAERGRFAERRPSLNPPSPLSTDWAPAEPEGDFAWSAAAARRGREHPDVGEHVYPVLRSRTSSLEVLEKHKQTLWDGGAAGAREALSGATRDLALPRTEASARNRERPQEGGERWLPQSGRRDEEGRAAPRLRRGAHELPCTAGEGRRRRARRGDDAREEDGDRDCAGRELRRSKSVVAHEAATESEASAEEREERAKRREVKRASLRRSESESAQRVSNADAKREKSKIKTGLRRVCHLSLLARAEHRHLARGAGSRRARSSPAVPHDEETEGTLVTLETEEEEELSTCATLQSCPSTLEAFSSRSLLGARRSASLHRLPSSVSLARGVSSKAHGRGVHARALERRRLTSDSSAGVSHARSSSSAAFFRSKVASSHGREAARAVSRGDSLSPAPLSPLSEATSLQTAGAADGAEETHPAGRKEPRRRTAGQGRLGEGRGKRLSRRSCASELKRTEKEHALRAARRRRAEERAWGGVRTATESETDDELDEDEPTKKGRNARRERERATPGQTQRKDVLQVRGDSESRRSPRNVTSLSHVCTPLESHPEGKERILSRQGLDAAASSPLLGLLAAQTSATNTWVGGEACVERGEREQQIVVSSCASLAPAPPGPVQCYASLPDVNGSSESGFAQLLDEVLRSSPQLLSSLLQSSSAHELLAKHALQLVKKQTAATSLGAPSISADSSAVPSSSSASLRTSAYTSPGRPSSSAPFYASQPVQACEVLAAVGRLALQPSAASPSLSCAPQLCLPQANAASDAAPAGRGGVGTTDQRQESKSNAREGRKTEEARASGIHTAKERQALRRTLLAKCQGDVQEMKERVLHLRVGVEQNLSDMKEWMVTAADEIAQVYVHHPHPGHASEDALAVAKLKEELERERSAFSLSQTQQQERLSLLQLQVYGLEEQLMLAETTRDKHEKALEQMRLLAKEEAETHRDKVRSLRAELEALKEEKDEREQEEEKRRCRQTDALEEAKGQLEQTMKERQKLELQLKRMTVEQEELRREQETLRSKLKESEEALRETREREEVERKKREALGEEKAKSDREEAKLVEDIQRLHAALGAKEGILTEMKKETELVKQELEQEKQLRALREQDKAEAETELAELRKREEEEKEKTQNLQQELTRLQRNVEQTHSQREQETRRQESEKERLRKQIEELEAERQAMQADATARLEEHLRAEEKLREEAQSLRVQQRRKTSVEEELLATKTELQHLKDELKDLLAEEVGKRDALAEENAKQQAELESKQGLVRSLLQQKSTLEIKLQETQRREMNLQRDVRKAEEEIQTLKQAAADAQLERDQQKLAIQRKDMEEERLKQHIKKLDLAANVHQEELLRRQQNLTEALERHQATLRAASKWKSLYTSQQSELQQLRGQLVTLHRSLLKRGEEEDSLLFLHLEDQLSVCPPQEGQEGGDAILDELEQLEATDGRGTKRREGDEQLAGDPQRGVRTAAARALALLLNAPVFQPTHSKRVSSLLLKDEDPAAEGLPDASSREREEREEVEAKGRGSEKSGSSRSPRPSAVGGLSLALLEAAGRGEAAEAADEATGSDLSSCSPVSFCKPSRSRGRAQAATAVTAREEAYAFHGGATQSRDEHGKREDGRDKMSEEGTPRFGPREVRIGLLEVCASSGIKRQSPPAEDRLSSRETAGSSSSLPGLPTGTTSRQTTASSDASDTVVRLVEVAGEGRGRDAFGRREESNENSREAERGGRPQDANAGDELRLQKTNELMQLRRQIEEVRKEEGTRTRELSQHVHTVYTLEEELAAAEENLSRATCTCEIAFHDILAQSGRYHVSAEILQKIEAAGKDVSLLPSLRQMLRAHLREKEKSQRGYAEATAAKPRRRGPLGRFDLRDKAERDLDREPLSDDEQQEMVLWMNHLVQETERACFILEGAHAARDAAARERQQLQQQVEVISSELREKRLRLRSLDDEAKRLSASLSKLREKERTCLLVIQGGKARSRSRPLLNVSRAAGGVATVLKQSAETVFSVHACTEAVGVNGLATGREREPRDEKSQYSAGRRTSDGQRRQGRGHRELKSISSRTEDDSFLGSAGQGEALLRQHTDASSSGSAGEHRGDEVRRIRSESLSALVDEEEKRHSLYKCAENEESVFSSSTSVFDRLEMEHQAAASADESGAHGGRRAGGCTSEDPRMHSKSDSSRSHIAQSGRDMQASSGGCSFWVPWSESKGALEGLRAGSVQAPGVKLASK
ncbi:hypothetical protein BESB_038980 [Besnoitia besnoiti]|uniref:Uncharacterized protein n=1 Tax=Besnoitia besnoiti TaxID=94643 RepID=A0A2A9MNW4_BESBE|nr:hypothetical protein BESB_038980 [Besnoitia besnoiti]PFH37440.1 hypothetical protein BESB_038980 [Besnoitia besnoiti]